MWRIALRQMKFFDFRDVRGRGKEGGRKDEHEACEGPDNMGGMVRGPDLIGGGGPDGLWVLGESAGAALGEPTLAGLRC